VFDLPGWEGRGEGDIAGNWGRDNIFGVFVGIGGGGWGRGLGEELNENGVGVFVVEFK
jgi:hypothetical protein